MYFKKKYLANIRVLKVVCKINQTFFCGKNLKNPIIFFKKTIVSEKKETTNVHISVTELNFRSFSNAIINRCF